MAFFRFWACKETRDLFLSKLDVPGLATFRLTCYDCSNKGAEVLFRTIEVRFSAATFTRQARMSALQRIGQYVRTLKFIMPHDERTFLPPLLDPHDGSELDFVYAPNPSSDQSMKFGTEEVNALLIRQYDPIFHSACDLQSFITAFSAMAKLETLHIATPGQSPSMRYRTSAVDYAMISIRMAVERSPLEQLRELVLSPVHPASIQHFRSGPFSCGSSPSAGRKWRQIKDLTIHMEAWDFDAPDSSTDHLKLLREYIMTFASQLTHFDFEWIGRPGPFPLALDKEPLLRRPLTELSAPRIVQVDPIEVSTSKSEACGSAPRRQKYQPIDPPPNTPCSAPIVSPLASLITNLSPLTSALDLSHMLSSPTPHSAPAYLPSQFCLPRPRKMRLRRLEQMKMRGCTVDASQVDVFIRRHAKYLKFFEFFDTVLRSGDWTSALRYLDRISDDSGRKERTSKPNRGKRSSDAACDADRGSRSERRVSTDRTQTALTAAPPAATAWTPITTAANEIRAGFSDTTFHGGLIDASALNEYACPLPQFEAPEPSPVRKGIRAALKQKLQALQGRAEARRHRLDRATLDEWNEADHGPLIDEVILLDDDALPPTPSLTAASSAASSLRSLSLRSSDSLSLHRSGSSRKRTKLHKRPRIDDATLFTPVDSAIELSGPVERVPERVLPAKLRDRRPRIVIPPGLVPPLERHPSEREMDVGGGAGQMMAFKEVLGPACYQMPGSKAGVGLADGLLGDQERGECIFFDEETGIGDCRGSVDDEAEAADGFIPILLQRFSKLNVSDWGSEGMGYFPGGYI